MWNELMEELEKENPEAHEQIKDGRFLREKMHEVSIWLKGELSGLKVNPKKQRFRSELANQQSNYFMADFGQEGLRSPLDPKIKCLGVYADKSTIFSSAIQPVLF